MSKKDDKYWGPLSNKSYWLKRSEELDKVAKMTEKEAAFESYSFPMVDEVPDGGEEDE